VNGSRGTSSHASSTRGTLRAPGPGQASSRGGPLAAGASVSPRAVLMQPSEKPVADNRGSSTCTWWYGSSAQAPRRAANGSAGGAKRTLDAPARAPAAL
jgi:hypothetical protein